MSTTELKNKLIEKIKSTNDEELLREASRLLEIQLNEIEQPYQLSKEMNEAVNEARNQIKNGEFLDHDSANQEIDKWLEE